MSREEHVRTSSTLKKRGKVAIRTRRRAVSLTGSSSFCAEKDVVSNEAARRISTAALVADRIHRETLVLINLYARDAEEQKRLITHAWTMRVVLEFLYAVTGGAPKNIKRATAAAAAAAVVVDDEEMLDEHEDKDDGDNEAAKARTPIYHYSHDLQTAIQDAFTRLYAPLHHNAEVEPLSREGMPGNALGEIATRIAASINTNIKRHYWKRQVTHIMLRDKCKKEDARALARKVNDAACTAEPIADDSLPNVTIGDGSIAEVLESFPERFIPVMWHMNRLRETSGVRRFAVLPLATGFVPGGCLHLDTDSFVTLMTSRKWSPKGKPDVTDRMVKVLSDIKKAKKERIKHEKEEGRSSRPGRRDDVVMLNEKAAIWEAVFPRLRSLFHSPQRRRFSGHITTDGVSVSLGIMYPPAGGFVAQPPLRAATKTKRTREANAPLEGKKKKKKNKSRIKTSKVTSSQEAKEEEEEEGHEDPMIAAVRLRRLPVEKIVGADPGKHVLLHLTNEDADGNRKYQRGKKTKEEEKKKKKRKTLRYTFAQRREESGANKHRQRLKNRPPPQAVRNAQQQLSKHDSRATSLAAFSEYVSASRAAWSICRPYYERPHQRIVRWQNWRGRRSSEDRFAQRVVDTFGEDAVIAYGSAKGFHALRGLEPSPTVGLRKRLEAKRRALEAARRGKPTLCIITTPEHYTTKTCARCNERSLGPSEDHKRTNRSGVQVCLRGIRRCNNDKCGCFHKGIHRPLLWDRDHNAAINIRRNLLYRLENNCWDARFSAADSSTITTVAAAATASRVPTAFGRIQGEYGRAL